MKVLTISVTERGRAMSERLPFERSHGGAADTVRSMWGKVDGFVLILATGAAVRLIAPLLGPKRSDPAVVCLDEAGNHAVALLGGHSEPGANSLAAQVASLVGATPVITTATDVSGQPALDRLAGFTTSGDVAAVTVATLDGRYPLVVNPLGWPIPPSIRGGEGPEKLVVTDERPSPEKGTAGPGVACIHPKSLVAGIGASSDAGAPELSDLLELTLAEAGLVPDSLSEVATVDRRKDHPALAGLGLPVRTYPTEALAPVDVPSPSSAVAAAMGTHSVAEAAALLAAGPGARLVVAKQKSARTTVAVARRRKPRGSLSVVGTGPGGAEHRTAAAERAIRNAEVVIGYEKYLAGCHDLLSPSQQVLAYPIGAEAERAERAVSESLSGRRVAVVSSGDPGIYGMASVILGLATDQATVDTEVIPGVTAAAAAAASLGAPLGHDHVTISLSDLLTPWELIESRLRAAAEADMPVAIYNPRSRVRTWQLDAARKVLLEHREPWTPVGVVSDACRPGDSRVITTLVDLDAESVGMTTCVIVGSSATRVVGGRMVTPRGGMVTPEAAGVAAGGD